MAFNPVSGYVIHHLSRPPPQQPGDARGRARPVQAQVVLRRGARGLPAADREAAAPEAPAAPLQRA
eukprot:5165608-Pyramimonas_sp.AAC.1